MLTVDGSLHEVTRGSRPLFLVSFPSLLAINSSLLLDNCNNCAPFQFHAQSRTHSFLVLSFKDEGDLLILKSDVSGIGRLSGSKYGPAQAVRFGLQRGEKIPCGFYNVGVYKS